MKMYLMRLSFFPVSFFFFFWGGGGGGGYSLLWPIRGCAAKQGMVVDLLDSQGVLFRFTCTIDLIC